MQLITTLTYTPGRILPTLH